MVPMHQADQYQDNDHNPDYDVLKLYQNVLDTIKPSFKEVIHDRIVIEYDMHHTPIEHLHYVERVLPQYPVSDDIRLQIEQEDAKIRNGTYNRNYVPNTGVVRL
jgi:hypothetical protein